MNVLASNEFVSNTLVEKGFRLPNDSVSKHFFMMKKAPEVNYLADYIVKSNYKIPKTDALDIATNIIKVSLCFKVDPWILAGLVQKESSFARDAVSPTNAAGLTQFTSSGFKEVNDQLGFRGKSEATDAAISFFNTQILECVDPHWVHLWIRIALPEADDNFYNNSKEEIKTDVQTALVYGAILLKTYVAYADMQAIKMEVQPSMSETYFQALQIYNGEDGDAKVNYAKNIFQNLKAIYPVPVNFSFLN